MSSPAVAPAVVAALVDDVVEQAVDGLDQSAAIPMMPLRSAPPASRAESAAAASTAAAAAATGAANPATAMPQHKEYDVIVIGAGSGGITASISSARWGARTLLIEARAMTGGDCTWTGCVPSKALIRAARAAKDARSSGKLGIGVTEVTVDYVQVRKHIADAQKHIYENDDSPEVLRRQGVEMLTNTKAEFESKYTLLLTRTVDGVDKLLCHLHAKRVVLCTGAKPRVPSIAGIDAVPYRTAETIWKVEELPKSLLVLGAGPIGCELAQAYARLGSKVTLVGKLLPRETAAAAAALRAALGDDGVRSIEARVMGIVLSSRGADGVIATLTLSDSKGTTQLSAPADEVLVAMGRSAASAVRALQLHKATGASASADTVDVDNHLSVRGAPHVFGVGDMLGGAQFTHLAVHQGAVAGWNAAMPKLLWQTAPRDADVPRCTFTTPEIGSIGPSLAEARLLFSDATATTIELSAVDRAVADDATNGFITLVHRGKKGTILGATVVAHAAGEMISEIAVARKAKLTLKDIATVMHPYPSMSFGIQVAAGRSLYSWVETVTRGPLFGCLRFLLGGRKLRGAANKQQ